MKIIHKYILKEIFPYFFLGNIFFVLLLLLDKIIDLADLFFTKNIPAYFILQTIVFYMPSFLVITIPTAAMLAVMIGFGRLSADSEVIAMRASGANKSSFTYPTVLFGISAFIIGLAMSLWLMPVGSKYAINILAEMTKYISIKDMKERELYDEIPGLVFYSVKKIDDQHYKQMVIIDENKDSIITAKDAEIIPTGDAGLVMKLKDGRIVSLDKNSNHSTITFGRLRLNTQLLDPESLAVNSERVMQTKDLIDKMDKNPIYKFELSKRVSMPFAAIIMSIFGMSIGVFFHRGGKSLSVPITIAVVAVYNILFFAAENLASSGRIEPVLAAWVPNILFLFITAFFYRRAQI